MPERENGLTVRYVYDSLNRISKAMTDQNAATAYEYDEAGNIIHISNHRLDDMGLTESCLACGAELPDGLAFCTVCGTPRKQP